MTAAITWELAEHPELAYRHCVDEYHDMIAGGSVKSGEPFELLDGQIVRKIRSASGENFRTVGIEHALIVLRLGKLSNAFEANGWHVRTQQPITLPPRDEPEPDAAIVRGSLEDYTRHHPGAADILCVIEVAESSLPRDRGYKLQLYANAGIAMYVIVDLLHRVVEVYREPMLGEGRYNDVASPFTGSSIKFPTTLGPRMGVSARQMFI